MAIAPERAEISIRRHFTTEGVDPYERSAGSDVTPASPTRDGAVAFEQLGVEVPESWSVNATNILAQKYFRGTLGAASGSGRCGRWPTGWSTPSPPGASRTATSSTTRRRESSTTSSST